jgi:tetratricopeptide (TPR) repeat protein
VKRITTALFFTFIIIFGGFCDTAVIVKADTLYREGELQQGLRFLLHRLPSTTDDNEKSEMLWRCSRFALRIGDKIKEAGAAKEEILTAYEQGVTYAEKAIQSNPMSADAYFFRASNIGRWGQTKGIFKALEKAEEMKDTLVQAVTIDEQHSLSWYVLGMLYEQIPGGLISFGNIAFSVSLGRKSIHTMHTEIRTEKRDAVRYDYYTELAKHLYKRNWTKRFREKQQQTMLEQYNRNKATFEKNCYFEGTRDLPSISDREEAKQLLRWVIDELEKMRNRNFQQNLDLEKVRGTYEKLF